MPRWPEGKEKLCPPG
uniref:Uncharacterized protein n=1 Tax=Arundo donax TaxID=35708 RepID=A0A0A9AAB8_ARUDO